MDRGNRKIKKSDSETKAVSESNILFGSLRTKTANDTKDTWKNSKLLNIYNNKNIRSN